MITANGIEVKPTLFPDGTSQVWKLTDEQLAGDSPVIGWRFENEAEVFHVLQLLHLVSSMGKKSVLVAPFLPYGRQDKPVENQSTFALRTLCLVLSAAGVDAIETVDAHSNVLWDCCSPVGVGVRDRQPTLEINMAWVEFMPTLLCFPDRGAECRYRFLMDSGADSIVLDKDRDQSTGEIRGLVVESGSVATGDRVLIIDDLCDGGRTFIEAAKLLHSLADGVSVGLYVSHGIFSKGTQVLFDAGIDRIFTKEGEVAHESISTN